MTGITFDDLRALFSADGQQALFDIIEEARRDRGAAWLDSLKSEYPQLQLIAELVIDHDAGAALQILKAQYPLLKLGVFDQAILDLHGRLFHEFTKPRNL